MEEIKMEVPSPKKFKFKIRVQADCYEGRIDGKTFADAANDWYNLVGKKSLEEYFQQLKQVNDYSYLQNFRFSDSVDKETYD